ncbi:nucleotidyltransferase domain-containing protein [uncultured Chitinophaga sp.]|jgi:Predicted nucleotidyltransferase|uniref:nucleotidyltransferase domain-containing protein n=1 Tax=uncultured Chitinophaga sp. TaxID=339340 RepID=UPI00263A219A|nr:nucleotidyltransferase domain-containing protein [uncultured Chitinophaga sp.]
MLKIIQSKLSDIEEREQVRILYACESGSRAWGFASPDSDYDVRFIYTRRASDYLSIVERKDIIELPVNEVLDIGGWDIRKALQLFLKSNASLYEWLQSPIVYSEDSGLKDEMLSLAATYFSNRAGCHHYLSMAANTLEYELQGSVVKMKKYFYALRPALACLWVVEKKTMPPMQFRALRTLVEDARWHSAVDDLLIRKQAADEKTVIPPIPLLHEWLQATLAYCRQQSADMPRLKNDTNTLDNLFRKYIHPYDV